MVYVACDSRLVRYPGAEAIAFRVVVSFKVIGEPYVADVLVGVLPSTV